MEIVRCPEACVEHSAFAIHTTVGLLGSIGIAITCLLLHFALLQHWHVVPCAHDYCYYICAAQSLLKRHTDVPAEQSPATHM